MKAIGYSTLFSSRFLPSTDYEGIHIDLFKDYAKNRQGMGLQFC